MVINHQRSSGTRPVPGVSPSTAAAVAAAAAGAVAGREPKSSVPIDYSRYVRKFSNAAECGSNHCRDLNYREHFHCLDCNSRVFVKKEEMIRHFKWHKKRDESLQHGFMRYSPMDDCSDRFPGCSHNRKQTHYHCLKQRADGEGCEKVYISTSDVQMHANYHRKDSAIIQEGFQRYRATEECGAAYCAFFGQRTTHFHCRRSGCKYTFKNKADMDKHKTYHIKDEQLNRDGFKKFMKQEACPFEQCRFSRVCNHIHCIRSGCNYVLHSSGQLYSHKRKHERQDNEMAYRKFKLAQSMMKSFTDPQGGSASQSGYPNQQLSPEMIAAFTEQMQQEAAAAMQAGTSIHGLSRFEDSNSMTRFEDSSGAMDTNSFSRGGDDGSSSADEYSQEHTSNGNEEEEEDETAGDESSAINMSRDSSSPPTQSFHKYTAAMLAGLESGSSHQSFTLTSTPLSHGQTAEPPENLSAMDLSGEPRVRGDDVWRKFLTSYGTQEKCSRGSDCEFIFQEHFHCHCEGCDMTFRSREGVWEHARSHEQQEQVTEAFYMTTEPGQEPCDCPPECPYQNKERHYHCGWETCREIILPSDKPFRRLDHYKMHEYSRKLSLGKDGVHMTLSSSIDGMFRRKRGRPPKNRVIEFPMQAGGPGSGILDSPQAIFTSFKLPKPSPLQAPESPAAADGARATSSPELQDEDDMSPDESKPLLPTEVQEGFYVFLEGTECPDQLCIYSGRYHYHCTQPRCFYVTDRDDILLMHSKDFHDNIDIMDGFVFFDRSIDCRLPSCHSNKVNRHFHCTRAGCGYSFVRYSTMALHEQKHREESGQATSNAPTHSSPAPPPPNSPPAPSASPLSAAGSVHSGGSVSSSRRNKVESPPSSSTPHPEISALKTVVKAAGTYYPLSAFSSDARGGDAGPSQSPLALPRPCPPSNSVTSPRPPSQTAQPTPPSQQQHCRVRTDLQQAPRTEVDNMEQALGRILQSQAGGDAASRPEWMAVERHPRYGPELSCKLERLRPHIQKHSSGAISPGSSHTLALSPGAQSQPVKREMEDSNARSSPSPPRGPAESPAHPWDHAPTTGMFEGHELPAGFPPHSAAAAAAAAAAGYLPSPFALMSSQSLPFMHQPGIYSSPAGLMFAPGLHHPAHHQVAMALHQHQQQAAQQQHQMNGLHEQEAVAAAAAMSSLLGKRCSPTPLLGSNHQDMSNDAKKARIQSSMRILKDEPVPEGYLRFRFNEDCKYPHCGYREHQTHFHCMRIDCGYSFCDKTRFVQHTARHERLDTLMGGDFQQFRANVHCGRPDCAYASVMPSTNVRGALQNKASHFHCLKCDFVCTDTNKVVAHRRQHQKLDSIMAAGFEKFTPSQTCTIEGCAHNQKQTHYHCLSCHYAVLGLSQMSAHKYRHLE
ncbi:hypothetical protein B566_EDAN000631 [Ephemera danica]|nr:hypothetical protein B566_EDAN000631 [Ephemera danica]